MIVRRSKQQPGRCIWSLRVSLSKEKEGRKSREVVAFSWWLADGTGPSHPLEPSASSGQNRVKKANIWRIFFFFVFNPQKVSNCNKRFFFFLLGALKARQQGFTNILGCDIWTVSGFVTRDDDWPAEVDTCSLKEEQDGIWKNHTFRSLSGRLQTRCTAH